MIKVTFFSGVVEVDFIDKKS